MDTTTWRDRCAAFAAAHRVPAEALAPLDAFRAPFPRGGPPPGPEPDWEDDFEALERHVDRAFDASRISSPLAEEAEGQQPALFARRVLAVEGLLRDAGTPEARVLRVGLGMRLLGILREPAPRLSRVRAIADYYYSLAVRLRFRGRGGSFDDLVAEMRVRRIAPGIEHACLDGLGPDGPLHANLLRVDPGLVDVRADPCAPDRPFTDQVAERGPAAVSGGFFLYSEPDIELPSRRHDPVGLLVSGGCVLSPAVFARTALLVEGASASIRPVALDETWAGPGRLDAWWNRAHAETGPDRPCVAVVGDRVVATGRCLPVPLNGYVAEVAGANLRIGAEVRYGAPAATALAGGPRLVVGGRPVLDMRAEDFWGTAPPITFSQDETGDTNLLARMAVGLDPDGRLLVLAVDGRNASRSLGVTLGQMGALLVRLGAHTAMNLDGGSSKRMVVDGRVVDLPSTEILAVPDEAAPIRPVHTALFFTLR